MPTLNSNKSNFQVTVPSSWFLETESGKSFGKKKKKKIVLLYFLHCPLAFAMKN